MQQILHFGHACACRVIQQKSNLQQEILGIGDQIGKSPGCGWVWWDRGIGKECSRFSTKPSEFMQNNGHRVGEVEGWVSVSALEANHLLAMPKFVVVQATVFPTEDEGYRCLVGVGFRF